MTRPNDFQRLFDDPDAARHLLHDSLLRARPSLTGTLVDTVTVEHAFSYLRGAFDDAPHLLSRFRLAFVTDLRRTPRTVGAVEREFLEAWPDRLTRRGG